MRLHLDRELEEIIQALGPGSISQSRQSHNNTLTSVCVFAFSQSFPYRDGRSVSVYIAVGQVNGRPYPTRICRGGGPARRQRPDGASWRQPCCL